MVRFILIWIHPRVTTVIEKPTESELEKGVNWMFPIIQRIVHFIFVGAIPQLVWHDRIKIGRVGSKPNFGYIGSCFVAKATIEINTVEERVRLEFTGTTSAQSLISRRTQTHN